MITRLPETSSCAASAVTAARIGPAQGVQTTDSAAPSATPERKPSPVGSAPLARVAMGWKSRPAHSASDGTSSISPAKREQHDRDRVQEILRQAERGEHARGGERERDE